MSSKQKLELTWIGKEKRPRLEPRILVEVPEKSYHAKEKKGDADQFENMLIHGDNLLALKALEQEYSGQIKCIYIDPPYNTGNAFDHYDDCLEHSIWLGLMRERLQLLQNLLAEDGFLCCQIDDSEGAYLKVLLDEIFGRSNYLNTFYIQVRYPNKTLAEDSDYQKVIEQCHVYTKQKNLAKLNRPQAEYDISKFKWKIVEITPGKVVTLGNKRVEIFKSGQYRIEEIEPCLEGLKETWATGSLARVKASAGEFFELYLADRKNVDGLGCLYKVEGIGEDGLGFRYISGPKKATANKGKFYSGIPLKRLDELKTGKSFKYLPVANFCDFSGNFGNCRLEGSVDFNGGKKPESLLEMILRYYSNPGDLVLDSFLGSGTTAAVAHKMGRRWIGIELGNHCYTHCIPRLQKVIDGTDQGGITKSANWQGGGGFRFFELGESLIQKDKWGQEIINKNFNAEMLAQALCKIEGFIYAPSKEEFFIHGHSTESDFIYVTTNFMTAEYLKSISEQLGEKRSLLICCKGFESSAEFSNLTVKKIPKAVLDKCEWGHDDYSLNVANLPMSASVPVQAELFDDIEGDEK